VRVGIKGIECEKGQPYLGPSKMPGSPLKSEQQKNVEICCLTTLMRKKKVKERKYLSNERTIYEGKRETK
jgi:hypothetical protein